MLALYVFCAALGVPLVALLALGGGDVDGGIDLDADLDVDLDASPDLSGAGHGVGDLTGFVRRVPLSSYPFFLAFFGVGGILGTVFEVGFLATIVLALAVGIISASINTALFTFLRNSETDGGLSDRDLEGRVATVSVPIEEGKRGRVWLDTGVERLQLTATSLEGQIDTSFAQGEKVLIVRVADGVAKVMGVDTDLAD